MKNNIKLYDAVKTLVNKNDIPKGSIGAIICIYNDPEGYEVEIFDKKGETVDILAYEPNEIEPTLMNIE